MAISTSHPATSLDVSGGQSSIDQADNFAARAGLRGVDPVPRDAGYPQISFTGVQSTMGHPTSFVYRANKSLDLYDNFLINKGKHKVKFGTSHLMFRPADPDTARGSFAFTNRWTSSQVGGTDGNAFADFLLGYPTSPNVGIGRGERFAHQLDSRLYPGRLGSYESPDDQRWTPLRIQPAHAGGDNRLSAVDLTVPGGRYVISMNKDGT